MAESIFYYLKYHTGVVLTKQERKPCPAAFTPLGLTARLLLPSSYVAMKTPPLWPQTSLNWAAQAGEGFLGSLLHLGRVLSALKY